MLKKAIFVPLALFIVINLNGQTINSYTSANSDLPGDIVKAVFVDEHGNKWFGTNQGLALFDNDSWVIYTTDTNDFAVADNEINDIAYQLTQYGSELWIGTVDGISVAAYDVDGITAATSYRSGDEDVTLVSNMINAITLDSANVRYFGTDSGLAIFAGQTWLYFDKDTDPEIPDIKILSLAAEEDSIYIGLKGASYFNAEGVARIQNKVDGYTGASTYVFPYNVPSAEVFEIFLDSEGLRWFGTGYGIIRHTLLKGKDDGKDMLISSENGLAGDSVYAIYEDPLKNMWFGTNHGVSKMNTSGQITNFTTSDGLINDIVYDIDFDAASGNIWFATEGGVSCMENALVNIPVQKLKNQILLSVIPSVISEYAEIRFNTPSKGYVELALYNTTGQKVNTLYRGYMNKGEQVYSLNVSSGKYSRGIYILRLHIQNNITTKKIIIL
ncbi:MAG: T9SS type A sorting domain-containing protein [Bacteroidales bacterium]|nr:MAG: T9SS type A sorting domain-containing protein [Bacteroidales bacterium]